MLEKYSNATKEHARLTNKLSWLAIVGGPRADFEAALGEPVNSNQEALEGLKNWLRSYALT